MIEVLLVEPAFPYPTKSKHKANSIHKNFLPIGLLKLGAYYRSKGADVKLVRGNLTELDMEYYKPSLILITSLFTYWSKYMWEAVAHYRQLFPKATIQVGGIYVTLHHNTPAFREKAKEFRVKWHVGLHKGAEKMLPDYSLLNGDMCDYHVTHAMRGCIRRCSFCGTWRIEPTLMYKTPEKLINELEVAKKNKVIFFDNNFLANPHVKDILKGLAEMRVNNHPIMFESQSGFDGRLLEKDPELSVLLKNARFQNIRIAWDNSISDAPSIKKQIKHLTNAGYPAKDISVFMIYNYNTPYKEMLKKLSYCKQWGVQIVDCRYRPLEATSDNYSSSAFRKGQTEKDYYIHSCAGWTDKRIRRFRHRVRKHNIYIRYAKDKGLSYDKNMEKWSAIHNTFKFFNLGRPPKFEIIQNDPALKERIKTLSSLKSYYKRNSIEAPDLSNFDKNTDRLDEYLKKLTGGFTIAPTFSPHTLESM